METTARNLTISGIVIGATMLILLLVLFSCTVNADPQGYGYTYHRDENGYAVTVDVSEDEQIPPEWDCRRKKGAFRTLTCDIRVDGAQGPNAENLTKQEVEVLVREEVERLRNTPRAEPKPESDSSSSDSPIDWPNWIMAWAAVVTAVVAIASLAWLIFTQREHVPALVAKVRRPLAWLRRRLSGRAQTVGAGPGPLRHTKGWRPARRTP